MVTPTASDSIQFIAVAMRLGVTVGDLARSIHIYPSFGEIVKALPSRRSRLGSRPCPSRGRGPE